MINWGLWSQRDIKIPMHRWFLKISDIFFFWVLGKLHNGPFLGIFRRGLDFFARKKKIISRILKISGALIVNLWSQNLFLYIKNSETVPMILPDKQNTVLANFANVDSWIQHNTRKGLHGNNRGIFGFFFLVLYSTLLHLGPLDSTVSENAGIEPGLLHWRSDALTTRLDLLHGGWNLAKFVDEAYMGIGVRKVVFFQH